MWCQHLLEKGNLGMYEDRIATLTSYDPRHVEAWMRLEHGTLDHLPADRFESEVCAANACIREAEEGLSETLALSYGL